MKKLIGLFLGLCSLCAAQTVALFNDTSAWYHWGCTGTSLALKEQIVELGFEVISVPINETYAVKELPDISAFDDEKLFAVFREKNPKVIQAIEGSDAVVINGEGTIHDLRMGPKALLYIAHISKTRFNKHVEIVNHSAYPKDEPLLSHSFTQRFSEQEGLGALAEAETIYRKVYGELDYVAIRESLSRQAMKQAGIEAALSFDCLPLYIQKHYAPPVFTQEQNLVLSGSVVWTEKGGKALARYLEQMAEQGYLIKVLIGAKDFPAKDDKQFVEFLRKELKIPFEIIDAATMDHWLDTICHASLFISGRFHHTIAAFCLNTPYIALNSNTQKIHALSHLLAQKEPLLFDDPSLLEQLLERTEQIVNAQRPDNGAEVEKLCELAMKNFKGLSNYRSALHLDK